MVTLEVHTHAHTEKQQFQAIIMLNRMPFISGPFFFSPAASNNIYGLVQLCHIPNRNGSTYRISLKTSTFRVLNFTTKIGVVFFFVRSLVVVLQTTLKSYLE